MVTRARPSYSRVNGETSGKDTKQDRTKVRTKRAEFISTKIHAFLWIVFAVILILALDVYHVILNEERVHR